MDPMDAGLRPRRAADNGPGGELCDPPVHRSRSLPLAALKVEEGSLWLLEAIMATALSALASGSTGMAALGGAAVTAALCAARQQTAPASAISATVSMPSVAAATDWMGTPVCTKVGDKIPSVCLDYEFGDDQQKVNLAERCAGKKTLLLGLPGAFTPCCASVIRSDGFAAMCLLDHCALALLVNSLTWAWLQDLRCRSQSILRNRAVLRTLGSMKSLCSASTMAR